MIRDIKKEAERLMNIDVFDDDFDDHTLIEILCGSMLTLLHGIVAVLALVVIGVTFPIWGVPYLIYKAKRKEKI